jgi:hypothetical protein
MLKKKINGTWQHCYSVKKKISGAWTDTSRKYLQTYTNGSWERIRFPEITIIGYSFGSSGRTQEVYCTRRESSTTTTFLNHFGVRNNNYTGSSYRTTKGYFGTLPVKTQDVLSGALTYNNTDSDYCTSNVRISIVNFASETSTSFSNIYTIINNGSASQPDYTFSYTFSSSYNNIGIYIEVKVKTSSSSYPVRANGYISSLKINDVTIYTPTISYEL